jgi:hypothetical protein
MTRDVNEGLDPVTLAMLESCGQRGRIVRKRRWRRRILSLGLVRLVNWWSRKQRLRAWKEWGYDREA